MEKLYYDYCSQYKIIPVYKHSFSVSLNASQLYAYIPVYAYILRQVEAFSFLNKS